MSSTHFIDGSTPIVSAWLNDVNNYVYQGKQRGTVVATSGQTLFTVPFSYTVGANTLDVYVNGVRQVLGISYFENTTTSVVFNTPVPVTAIVEFIG